MQSYHHREAPVQVLTWWHLNRHPMLRASVDGQLTCRETDSGHAGAWFGSRRVAYYRLRDAKRHAAVSPTAATATAIGRLGCDTEDEQRQA